MRAHAISLPRSTVELQNDIKSLNTCKNSSIITHHRVHFMYQNNPNASKMQFKSNGSIFRSLLVLVFVFMTSVTHAGVDAKQFDNPEQEQAYTSLIDELRCLVCQNQNIADSNADLAKDLRRQVYEMVTRGQSKEEIKNYMLQRYGDFVLYNPPLKTKTAVLWLGPVVFLLLGIGVVIMYTRKKNQQDSDPLSKEQQQKLRDLLEKGDKQ